MIVTADDLISSLGLLYSNTLGCCWVGIVIQFLRIILPRRYKKRKKFARRQLSIKNQQSRLYTRFLSRIFVHVRPPCFILCISADDLNDSLHVTGAARFIILFFFLLQMNAIGWIFLLFFFSSIVAPNCKFKLLMLSHIPEGLFRKMFH